MVGRNRPRDFAFEDEPRPDTEVTLGPLLLLLLGCGLVLLCGTCFGAGYMMGRRSAPHTDAATQQSAMSGRPAAAQPLGAQGKPMAKGTATALPVPSTPAGDAAGSPGDATAAQNPLMSYAPAANAGPSQSAGQNANQALVHPALSAAESVPAAHVQPAVGGPMVQIAAVSHSEDADVLMSALRKRGYAVTARRVVGDNLIHVQIGPFASRAEANAMSQKLLGDGYNAVVLP
jgi:DedD protein